MTLTPVIEERTPNFTTVKESINSSLKTAEDKLIAEYNGYGQLGMAKAITTIINNLRAEILLNLYDKFNKKESKNGI